MPPVPAELASLVAQNRFIDFKLLLLSNLSVIAAQPMISLQSISRIPTAKLLSIQNFRDWSAAWAVYSSICIIGKINANRLPDLLEYFLIISEAANRPGFDWQKYDTLFRQNAMVCTDKRWGVLDPAIWVQCCSSPCVTPFSNAFSQSSRGAGSFNPSPRFCFEYKKSGICSINVNVSVAKRKATLK